MGKHEGLYHGKTGTDGIVGKLALITMLSLDGDIAYCVIYFFYFHIHIIQQCITASFLDSHKRNQA